MNIGDRVNTYNQLYKESQGKHWDECFEDLQLKKLVNKQLDVKEENFSGHYEFGDQSSEENLVINLIEDEPLHLLRAISAIDALIKLEPKLFSRKNVKVVYGTNASSWLNEHEGLESLNDPTKNSYLNILDWDLTNGEKSDTALSVMELTQRESNFARTIFYTINSQDVKKACRGRARLVKDIPEKVEKYISAEEWNKNKDDSDLASSLDSSRQIPILGKIGNKHDVDMLYILHYLAKALQ